MRCSSWGGQHTPFAAAGVSEQTIYYSFGTKEAVASAAADLVVAGDEQPIPTLERDSVRQALADPDPVGQLTQQVQGAAAVLLRAAPLLQTIRGAAAGKTALRAGLTAGTATDVCRFMLSPENYQLLISDFGWSHHQSHTWTRQNLIRELLPSGSPAELDSYPPRPA